MHLYSLCSPSLPLLPFYTGPTGVGKSELAKALAQELFDDEKHMVRAKEGREGGSKVRTISLRWPETRDA